MLLKGILQKDKNNKWIVWSEDGNEYWYPHEEHNLWLLIHGEENIEICFQVNDDKTAKLKSCYPDTREYIQD